MRLRWGSSGLGLLGAPGCFSAGAKLTGEEDPQAPEGGTRGQREVLWHREQVKGTKEPVCSPRTPGRGMPQCSSAHRMGV